MPVSYTHLDVYKRQVQIFADLIQRIRLGQRTRFRPHEHQFRRVLRQFVDDADELLALSLIHI